MGVTCDWYLYPNDMEDFLSHHEKIGKLVKSERQWWLKEGIATYDLLLNYDDLNILLDEGEVFDPKRHHTLQLRLFPNGFCVISSTVKITWWVPDEWCWGKQYCKNLYEYLIKWCGKDYIMMFGDSAGWEDYGSDLLPLFDKLQKETDVLEHYKIIEKVEECTTQDHGAHNVGLRIQK